MNRTILSFIFLLVCFTVAPALPQKAVLDFDGDNRTDYAVIRNSGGNWVWYIQRSTAGFWGQAWGISGSPGDVLIPADYDGDGKWDIAVWRPGAQAYFYILESTTGALRVVPFGKTGDDPYITQDFDGDGKADPAVTRISGGINGILTWYIQRSMLGFTGVQFGNNFDHSVRGDFDGDGKADVAVYRLGTGTPPNTFFVMRSSDGGVQAQQFGTYKTDYFLPGDFDGDGRTDYAAIRYTVTGALIWYWLDSSDNSFHALNFGNENDAASPGDYDGDGKTDQAVWRYIAPSTFYVNGSLVGFTSYPFGAAMDAPLALIIQVR